MENKLVDWIKRELQIRDWSIRNLARHSDVTHAHIAAVLRGDKKITWDFCASMSKALNEPVWKLFILAGLLDGIPEEISQNEELRVLLKIWLELPPEAQKDLVNYAGWIRLKY
jgi:transcriptional regulator with XRE-family HTH domain